VNVRGAKRLAIVSGIVATITLLGSLPGQASTIHAAPTYRPDGLLALGAGKLVGNNVYNSTGASQGRKVTIHRGKTAVFRWRLQNDGSSKDELCLRGAGGDSNFNIQFFLGKKNITAGVVAWTYMNTKPSRGYFTVTVKITAKAGAHIGAVRTEILTVTSTSSGLADTVLARAAVA
jgi:hypothetical protein